MPRRRQKAVSIHFCFLAAYLLINNDVSFFAQLVAAATLGDVTWMKQAPPAGSFLLSFCCGLV
jgi:hypothetical protein